MRNNSFVFKLCVGAMLAAIGILIPMFSPVRFVMEPASFTLASHVPIFIAMMISPVMAGAVSVLTTLGFFFGGFHIVIVLRAASHLVFALLGGYYLRRYPRTMEQPVRLHLFSLMVGVIHALCEVVVVSLFYIGGTMGEAYYQQGFLQSVLLLVGVGSVVHSMVDFEISLVVVKALQRQRSFAALTH